MIEMHKLSESTKPLTYLKDNTFILPSTFIGLEIEVEGYDCCTIEVAQDYFNIIEDGSLRNGGKELVFQVPLMGKDLYQALDSLQYILNEDRCIYNDRTSVHIHLDIRDLNMEELFKLLFLYIYMEKAIYLYTNKRGISSREHNNYCVPWWKTEGFKKDLYDLYNLMHKDDTYGSRIILSRFSKYSGLNINPITSFGSIEFRHHYGTHNKERLIEWINIIMSLKKHAINNTDIDKLISTYKIPPPLEIYMDEEITSKGMRYLYEIMSNCKYFKERNEEISLHLSNLNDKEPNLKRLDSFNKYYGLPKLRSRRVENISLSANTIDLLMDEEDIHVII